MKIQILISLWVIPMLIGCGENNDDVSITQSSPHGKARPTCNKQSRIGEDVNTPQSVVSDWSQPVRLGPPINTPCPEDAVEISRDGRVIYFMFTEDLIQNFDPSKMLSFPNGTYYAVRTGGPDEFDHPRFYYLGEGASSGSLDGELSFSSDGKLVYFHSNRAENTGYKVGKSDFLDIYVARISNGVPGPGVNLGPPVNSEYPDGEHTLHPDGKTLYFSSTRPGGLGGTDIYKTTWDETNQSWSSPVNLGPPINTVRDEKQPFFTPDGKTMYFVSDWDPSISPAIYRSTFDNVTGQWSPPEVVIKGYVGEPSITGDGKYMHFVHILVDSSGNIIDSDIWYSTKRP